MTLPATICTGAVGCQPVCTAAYIWPHEAKYWLYILYYILKWTKQINKTSSKIWRKWKKEEESHFALTIIKFVLGLLQSSYWIVFRKKISEWWNESLLFSMFQYVDSRAHVKGFMLCSWKPSCLEVVIFLKYDNITTEACFHLGVLHNSPIYSTMPVMWPCKAIITSHRWYYMKGKLCYCCTFYKLYTITKG